MSAHSQRERCGELMDLLVRRSRKVHYAQVRPMPTNTIRSVAQLRRALAAPAGIRMDCSESVTTICRLSGMRDPNGTNYNGSGYTGTMLGYLDHYDDPAKARIGALVVFGGGTGEHVCMVRRPGPDPLLFTHGTEDDPSFYPLSVMLRSFPGQPHTFLSVAKLCGGN